MKKMIIALCIIFAIVILIPKETEEFRIRVIANSDSTEDQKLKMKVVNALLLEIKDYNEANIEIEVKKNINSIDNVVKNILKEKDYRIDVKKVRFPPKELDNKVIPGGRYMALVVVIEEGKGKNWWSLLNPSFSKGFEDVETGDVEFKFYFFEELKKSFN